MSVIIRLQNLPWSANALDIRQYFHGLSIPEGGVHIVGGEQGDAFIAFSTDEDARQAMLADGGKIKEVKVKLLLSSRAEMQKVIEMARQQTLALQNFMQMPPQQPPLPPAIPHPPQAPQHPTPPHILGATPASVLGHLHMQQTHSPGPQPHHMLVGANIPHLPQHAAQQSPQHATPPPQQPQQPAAQQPLQTTAPSSATTSDKKDGDSSSSGRKDRRNRSRSRSRDNSRRRSRDKDKDRDRYRRRGGRSRSRSRDRRRRDRSRSRDRGRDRRGKSDKDSKDNKDKDQKPNGASDVLVVGQFGGRGGNVNKNAGGASSSAEARQRPQQKVQPQPAVTNGNLQEQVSGGGGVGAPGWNSNMPVSDIMLPTQERERAIVNPMIPPNANMMGLPSRIPGNFPPNSDIRGGFPFPGAQDQQAWMVSRQQGMPPQQGPQPPPMSRFEEGHPQGRGGFRGPPARPRPSRFEPMDGHGGPPEYPHGDVRDGPFPPARGRERPPFDDNYRGGPPRPPFRDNARAPRPIPHTCVEIRNVPVATAYRDVREFFQGMHVLNIKLINDEEGRRTGIAYVKFMNLESKEAALTMNGALLHGTPVEVLHLDDNIYDEATDSYQPNSECTIVALHGLPPYANEQDVRRLFPGARLINIVMTRSKNPQAPQVYVQFSTMQEGRRALAASGKLTVDGKDIFVERSTLETLMNTKKMIMEMGPEAHEIPEIKEKPTPPRQESKVIVSDCVHLQGLSQNSNDREIVDFFSDIGLVPARIHLMLDSNNTPSGDAFCEFTSCAEATRALAKNGNVLGSKDISVRAVTRNEMNQALGILEQKLNDEQAMLAARPMPPMGRNGPIPPEHMRGGPGPMVGPPMRGPPMHPAEFMGRGGRHYGEMRGGPHMRGHRGMHHGGPPMMGRPAPQAPAHHHPHQPEGPTVDNFGNPGCVIEMQNVPYKAEIDEIIEYFDGFDIARANVIRRYNDSGMPTGDARVSLQTPAEAQRAIQELKFKKMRDRQIYMCII